MGVRLKELRKKAGYTQEELAKKIGISKRTLAYWEKGENSIKENKLKILCKTFGVDMPYMLGYNNVKNETDIKASVLDEALEKLHEINNMVSVESDEDPNMWTIGFLTAIAAIESFKKEIEAQKDE
ncbi:helix-turn-helix domain-containing protein [Streptococcus macedonicus]|uniref:helix-turn-helix domain-containing protein n=1 Tax=Streptococcus macedonicus TaxID=59310 RepID=UPI000B830798|nr:helix-turn-helix transcriptional regulator [Streptococcus macedonicus]